MNLNDNSGLIGVVTKVYPFGRISVYLGRRDQSGALWEQPDGPPLFVSEADDSSHVKPVIQVDELMARELYAALGRFFGPDGHDQPRQLRVDYDAERARVDKLTDALITITKGGGTA